MIEMARMLHADVKSAWQCDAELTWELKLMIVLMLCWAAVWVALLVPRLALMRKREGMESSSKAQKLRVVSVAVEIDHFSGRKSTTIAWALVAAACLVVLIAQVSDQS
jgi:hypothetical protein